MAIIRDHLTAGYPYLHILTQEPHRAEEILAKDAEGKCIPFAWDAMRGIRKAGSLKVEEQVVSPEEAVSWLNDKDDTLLFAHNLHFYTNGPEVIQSIQNGIPYWKARGNCLCTIAPTIALPPELEKFCFSLQFALPDEERLAQIQRELSQSDGVNVEVNPEAVDAARGLTEFQAETAYAYSLATKRTFDRRVVSQAKGQMIQNSGFMKFWEPVDVSQLGGLGRFKEYFNKIMECFEPGSKKPRIRAILFAGIQGGGKSLSMKVIASMLKRELIFFDILAMKDQYVGETERKTRLAWATAEAFGTCVVGIDEIEKALGGTGEAAKGDTSVSQLSILLTGMQETKSDILLVATANRAYTLPGELLRRFDDIFFVDAPTLPERIEIIEIMNRRYPEANLPIEFAAKLEGFTGAEIEKIAKKSCFMPPEEAIQMVTPVTKTNKQDVDTIRAWAVGAAIPANTPEEEVNEIIGRRLKLA